MEKYYKKKGSIEAPVGRLAWRRDRFGVIPGGRSAKTDYLVENYYKKEGEFFSLVKAYPTTGRTHQLRIHFKHLGHPIMSDDFYAGRKTARHDRNFCPRLFLHASAIEFDNPCSSEELFLKSNLPGELQKVINSLEIV